MDFFSTDEVEVKGKDILIIDSEKSSGMKAQQSVHFYNASLLSKYLDADLIWSYPSVNTQIKTGYKKIIFNHASNYSYTDLAWLEKNPEAELYYICNDYNLGEPRTLWSYCKENGIKYNVIANHESNCTKITKKYVDQWYITNLNCLIYEPINTIGMYKRQGCIYFGSFRRDRAASFQKYLHKGITLSTHETNKRDFEELGCDCVFIPRINWKTGMSSFASSLYIEDDTTHENYSHLGNRFYECLNQGVVPIFDEACRATLIESGYAYDDWNFVSNLEELLETTRDIELDPFYDKIQMDDWCYNADKEKKFTLDHIQRCLFDK